MSICVYVASRKPLEVSLPDCCRAVFAGAAGSSIPEGFIGDDTGDNISEKNDSCCELTVLYWIWKNAGEDVVGLEHYRRFFAECRGTEHNTKHIVLSKKNAFRILGKEDIEKLLSSCDVIVKKSMTNIRANGELFRRRFGDGIIDDLRTVIDESHHEYLEDFDRYLTMNYHVNCNMFIGRKEVSDRYCEWLFDVLGKLDDMHTDKTGDRYHQRELGYMGELLFGVWLDHNRINYRFHPVVCTGEVDYDNPGKAECCLLYPHEMIKLKMSGGDK